MVVRREVQSIDDARVFDVETPSNNGCSMHRLDARIHPPYFREACDGAERDSSLHACLVDELSSAMLLVHLAVGVWMVTEWLQFLSSV